MKYIGIARSPVFRALAHAACAAVLVGALVMTRHQGVGWNQVAWIIIASWNVAVLSGMADKWWASR